MAQPSDQKRVSTGSSKKSARIPVSVRNQQSTGLPAKQRQVVGACPLDCPDGCSWVVTVEDREQPDGTTKAEAVKLRGNSEHPFTDGGLCKKVNPWLDYAVDRNRLLTPLRRVAPKGSSVSIDDQSSAFEPISWDEALAEIAGRFIGIIETTGPSAIWPFPGTGNVGYLQGAHGPAGGRLWNHLGVSDHSLTICSVSGHAGLGYTMGHGSGMDPEDVVHAGIVVLWGSNTLISNQHWWPFVEQARSNGAKIVVIDPTRTRTAERADVHIAPRVGTDGALALGLCRELFIRGAVDASYLAARTAGPDQFRDSIEQWTLARVAEVCGLSADEISQLVDDLVDRTPLAVKFGHGAQRHAGGGQAARAISCLPGLLGSFDHVGGGLVYSTGPAYELNIDAASGRNGRGPRSLAMTNLVANLTSLDPPVEGLFVYGANPVVSNPDTGGVRRALTRPDLFTVVVDLFHTDTTDYADIVLPSAMQHEQLELNNSFAHLYLHLNLPAVAPPGECLAHTEIFRRLARAMKLCDPSLYAGDQELIDALLDTPELADAGITFESLSETGWARLPNASRPYQPFATRFSTPSGKFEFWSERADAHGLGPLPSYVAPAEVGGNDGSAGVYQLVAAAGDYHLNSTFAGTEVTLARTTTPSVIVHPDDGLRDGLSDGAMVELRNDRGGFTAQLEWSTAARRGTAVSSKGWWSMELNNTVAERDSDMARGAVYHDNQVVIVPASL